MLNRRLVMYNDFVLIGPADDPAKVKGMKKAADAMKAIAATGSRFVSRGDNSGTHLLEKTLWKLAGVESQGAWRSEEHTSELQSRVDIVCRLLLEKKKT